MCVEKKRKRTGNAPAQRRVKARVFTTEIQCGMRDAAKNAGFDSINLGADAIGILDDMFQLVVDGLIDGTVEASKQNRVSLLTNDDLVAHLRHKFILKDDQEHLVGVGKKAFNAIRAAKE